MKRFLIVLGAMALVASCGSPQSSSSTPTPQPTTSPEASVVASPTLPAGFVLADASGGTVAGSEVVNVTVQQFRGYDRIVIEFASGVPTYAVTRQAAPTFTRSPRGDQVTLEGDAGVLIVIHTVTNWTSYGGPTSFQPGYPCIRQVLQVENYEGYQQWALGVRGTPALRVSVVASSLIVDVAAA